MVSTIKSIRRWDWRTVLPITSCLLAIVLDVCLSDAAVLVNVSTAAPFFRYAVSALAVVFAVCAVLSYASVDYRARYLPKTYFYAVLLLLLNVINVITKKTELLPAVYFPSVDRILAVFVDDWQTLLTCAAYSMRLLVLGILIGGALGFLTGVALGWNKKVYYWLFPFVRFIGPIPATIWIPLAMLLFPTLLQASVFIVGLSMWFPMTFLTSAGIQNVRKNLFEVGCTLGAKTPYQVIHIAIPAAMPDIFTGLFMGTVMSLISLVSAELIGARYGLGWYINWQQQVMSYPQVYAGFLVIALICFVVFKLLFGVRNRVLHWQKGVVRW